MRAISGRTDFRLIAGVLLGALAFIACAFFVTGAAVNHWIAKDSETHSQLWAETLASQIPDLREIAAGAPPSAEALERINLAKGMGKVFRFKIYDRDGHLRFISDETDPTASTTEGLATHNPTAARVVASGEPFTVVKDGTSQGRPATYASTYLPIMRGGQMIAVIEAYVDEAATAALFRRELTTAGIGISLLLLALVILPFLSLRRMARARSLSDARASFLAQHDNVTGLLNRAAFLGSLDKKLGNGGPSSPSLAVHHIDIDGFKALSEDLGPDLTDALIRLVAMRTRETVRTHDFVGRLGSDELLIAQCSISSRAQAEAMVRRLMARLSEPYILDERDVRLTFSVGSAMAPTDAGTGRELVHKASLALSFVKNAGGKDWCFFRDTMEEDMQRRRQLERRLRQATRDQDFTLYFQPIMSVATARVTGFEALLRLPDGHGGLVSPSEFIPIAERLGLLSEIGDWVLARACETAVTWPDGISIAVNLSPSQFAEGTLPDRVAEVLAATSLEPARLELEITENLLLRDDAAIMDQLVKLKALGVSIVMDDFGSGYSSLSYLWRFPFDKIKIDRSFMAAYTQSTEVIQKILAATVALGHALNMQVTIEGVETVFQARALETVACDRLQGYLFGKPIADIEIPASLLKEFLNTVNQLADQAQPPRKNVAAAS